MTHLDWVAPDACTLPSVEQPLRVAEFDTLFAESLAGAVLVTDTHARLELTGRDLVALAARAQDLAERETSCCSFFRFSLESTDTCVTLDVRVPAERVEVLQVLVRRATSVRERS
jgi:hypothetical protein